MTWAAEQGSTNTGSVAIYFNDSHASPGAFALQVVDPLSGQNYTFAASTNGSVRYKYVGNSYVILEVAG